MPVGVVLHLCAGDSGQLDGVQPFPHAFGDYKDMIASDLIDAVTLEVDAEATGKLREEGKK